MGEHSHYDHNPIAKGQREDTLHDKRNFRIGIFEEDTNYEADVLDHFPQHRDDYQRFPEAMSITPSAPKQDKYEGNGNLEQLAEGVQSCHILLNFNVNSGEGERVGEIN